MENTVLYFSATGNSLAAARSISEKLGNCSLLSIPDVLKNNISVTGKRIGIVFPVYMWGLPLIVVKALQEINFPENSYLFGCATCGSSSGGALYQFRRVLEKRGYIPAGGFNLVMPGNYTPLYGAPSEKKQQKMFLKSEKVISEKISMIKRMEKPGFDRGFFPFNILMHYLIYSTCSPRIPVMDNGFKVDESCTSCGICASVCPVNNIKMQKRPQWLHHCEHCMACLQWCPEQAIQYGNITRGRKRYHHPEVRLTDFT